MPTISKKTLAVFLIAFGIILSTATNAYLLRVGASATVLWSEEETYFFVSRSASGYKTAWILYPFLVGIELLGVIQSPNEVHASMEVIRVTSSGVERHEMDLDPTPGSSPLFYTPLEGRIWVRFAAMGGLCWWAGDHFQPATQEEKERLESRLEAGNEVEAGWSKRTLSRGSFMIEMGDGTEFAIDGGREAVPDSFRIEMRRPGQEPVTLFNVDRRRGRASRSEYLREFPNDQ